MGARAPELVRRYFQAKRSQLLAMGSLAVCEHTGLKGGHREEFQRVYLREVLPRRFEIGRGMIYGLMHRSREADIVVWDGDNFPALPMQDHAFFFAESVRLVLEAKSRWGEREFLDTVEKSRAVRDIVSTPAPDNLDQVIAMLELEVAALKAGAQHEGMMWAQHHIGTAAIFLAGGATALTDLSRLPDEVLEEADDCWPDVTLILEAGRVAIKDYGDGRAPPQIVVYDCGDDCLLVFTAQVLRLVADRSVALEGRFYFDQYMADVEVEVVAVAPFTLLRPAPSRVPLWRS